ncbi:efflux RND transporter periplasmic adaptor subunit [Stenotrophomonas acidaminiphila]|uniref:efflux RND transporter periplasmic adaptor subunit n=1 Tax=Stenotrophomonas acidaminiphila TaxID=128780 RepID=UPI0039BC7CAA
MIKFGAGAISLCLLLSACGGNTANESQAGTNVPPVEVEALTVAPRAHTVLLDLPGRIAPVRVAEVRARAAGIVQKRHFTEGATVKPGDLLFTIEPAPFEAVLARSQAALARTEAQVKQAESQARRYAPLVKADAVSQQEYDDAVAAVETARADQVSAEAEVKTARLNLAYTTVRAPIGGRIGRSLVSEGSLVGQGESTPMALIQQIDTVYADFTQPAAAVLRLREALTEGKLSASNGKEPAVSIRVDGTSYTAKGRLLFSDVAVDPGTGQVTLRGVFPNPKGVLLPGMYVRVSTEQGVDQQALFVPQRAVQRGPDGKATVIVVSAERKAQERQVETGAMQGAEWQITSGLEAGDQVIVQGADKIAPGTAVTVKPAGQAPSK